MNISVRTATIVLCSALACTRNEPAPQTAPNGSTSTPSASAVPNPALDNSPKQNTEIPSQNRPWYEAVRLENWPIAASELDAIPEPARNAPDITYLRARVALALKDWNKAITLFNNLENALPGLATDIQLHRAESHLGGGNPELAAQFFSQSKSVSHLTKASIAFFRAGNTPQAKSAIDRAIQAAKDKTTGDVVEARNQRARIAQSLGDTATAIADLRFVFRHTDDPNIAYSASSTLSQIDPNHRFTSSEHVERAQKYTTKGNADNAIVHLDQAANAPGGPPARATQLLARAKALMSSRDRYREAAQTYESAAKIKGSHVPEAIYYAAQAWSRADENQRGIELYGRVVREHGKSQWAERARYFGARLSRFDRNYPIAEKGYRAYLKQYPKGSFVKEVNYELGLCLLMMGDSKAAGQIFNKLAEAEREAFEANGLRYLTAVAAQKQGKSAEAFTIWRNLTSSQPLSYFSVMSSARLAASGEPSPPLVSPAPTSTPEPLYINLPTTVELLKNLGLVTDAEEHLRSHEESILAANGHRGGEALCNAYEQLNTGGRLHRVGQKHAPSALIRMAPAESNLWAWKCLFPTPYQKFAQKLEIEHSIPNWLVHSIIRQESSFNTKAVSPVGAQGLMQLMPKTASKTADRMQIPMEPDSSFAPHFNITIGASYLSMLLRMFHDNVIPAIAAYNAGPQAVGRWLKNADQIPLDVWVAMIPYRETRHYVWRVMGNWMRYRYLAEGESAMPTVGLTVPTNVAIPSDAY